MSAIVSNPGNLLNRKVVEDLPTHTAERLEFDSGAVLYIKSSKFRDEQTVFSNYEIKKGSDGTHTIDFNSPNPNFIDWG